MCLNINFVVLAALVFRVGACWHIHAGGVGGVGGGLKTAEILLAESCREQVSFESGFKQRKGRRISEIGWQRVPEFQTDGARKLEDLFKG